MIQLCAAEDGYAVTGAAVAEIAPWRDDPELRRIHATEAIRQGLASCDIDGKLAVCGLRGSGVVVRDFEFPNLPAEEIEAAVVLEASQICPFSIEDSSLDCQVTSSGDRITRGFWVAATNRLVDATRRLVHDAGLRCALLDVDGLALLNCMEGTIGRKGTSGKNGGTRRSSSHKLAVLDVGDLWTSVVIADDAGRPFVRDIGSGAEGILCRIGEDIGVSSERVCAALSGEAEAGVDRARLQDRFEMTCTDLIDDIAATLRYYGAQNGSARVDRMLVSGRFATIDVFIRLLRARLAVEVEPWNPLAGMPCEGGRECEALMQQVGATMAVATGLAMRSI